MTYIETLARINQGDFRDEIAEALNTAERNIDDRIAYMLYEDMSDKETAEIDKWLRREDYISEELLIKILNKFEQEYLLEANIAAIMVSRQIEKTRRSM